MLPDPFNGSTLHDFMYPNSTSSWWPTMSPNRVSWVFRHLTTFFFYFQNVYRYATLGLLVSDYYQTKFSSVEYKDSVWALYRDVIGFIFISPNQTHYVYTASKHEVLYRTVSLDCVVIIIYCSNLRVFRLFLMYVFTNFFEFPGIQRNTNSENCVSSYHWNR